MDTNLQIYIYQPNMPFHVPHILEAVKQRLNKNKINYLFFQIHEIIENNNTHSHSASFLIHFVGMNTTESTVKNIPYTSFDKRQIKFKGVISFPSITYKNTSKN